VFIFSTPPHAGVALQGSGSNLAQNVIGGHEPDSRGAHVLHRLVKRIIRVHGACGVLDHERLETLPARVNGCVVDTVVLGKTDYVQDRYSSLPKVSGQPGRRLSVILVKGRV
jgi:hypothetical protein